MRRWLDSVAILWTLAISIALLYNLSNTPLWQDEAESALNALTIGWDSPVPKGASDGEIALLHEMALYYKTDDPKYEYLPTHFMYTPYVTIHGWIPYYFMRAGMEIFGRNEFGPRFFSVVFFALSLAVLYLMLRARSPRWMALCVVAYYSLMPTMLGYALQARWYAYASFFSMCGFFFFLRFVETRDGASFAAWTVSEAMLYYTFVSVFVVHQLAFILFILISKRDCLKPLALNWGLLCLALFPHVLITKLPLLALEIPARHSFDLRPLRFMALCLEWNPFLILSAIAFVGLFFVRTLQNKLWKSADSDWRFDLLCILFIFAGYLVLSYTSPFASFQPRDFIFLVPIIVYCAFSEILTKDGERGSRLKAATFALMIVFLLINPIQKTGSSRLPDLFTGEFKPNQGFNSDASWVPVVIKFIGSSGADDPLILTSFEHYVFRYYGNYDAELIWPLRKNFIDTTTRHLFVIAEKDKNLSLRCESFLPGQRECCEKMETMKFYDRIRGCKETDISGVRVFDCPSVR